jgi:hypothetical protein
MAPEQPNLPVALPQAPNEQNTADLVKISKMLSERDRQRHVRRMDILAMCSALFMAVLCLMAAIYFGATGQPVLVGVFLTSPIGVALVNGLLGRSKKRK